MPRFTYTGRDRRGGFVESHMDANSADQVAGHLLETGITPIKIEHLKIEVDVLEEFRRRYLKPRVAIDELITLCRQLHSLTRAGIPIIRAILGLAESSQNPGLKDALEDIADHLKAGHELSHALQRHPSLFTGLFISIVQLGEKTGLLDQSFKQIALYLEQDRETKKQVKSALRYPMMVIGAIAIALIVVNVFVIPAFESAFDAFGAELPPATLLLMATSKFTLNYWPHALAAMGFAWWMLRKYLETEAGQYQADRLKLKIPLVGNVVLRATLARYARAFAMTTEAGMPVLETLTVVSRAVQNAYVAEGIQGVRARIERGETLTRAAAASRMFTPLSLQMMSVGEESGTVAEMHLEIAIQYEEEVEYDLKKLTELIEPTLIVIVGAIVFVLALGIYLPLWELGSNAQGG